MNTFTTIVTIVGTIGAGILAFLDLVRFPLTTRLFIVAAASLVVIATLSVKLAQWSRPKSRVLKGRLALGLSAMAVVVTAAVSALYVALSYHSVLYTISQQGDAIELRAWAPEAGPASVDLHYPSERKCLPFFPIEGQNVSVYQDDPDGPLPFVGVREFAAPQVVGLRCRPAVDPAALRVDVLEGHFDDLEIGRRDSFVSWFKTAGVGVWLVVAVGLLVWLFVLS